MSSKPARCTQRWPDHPQIKPARGDAPAVEFPHDAARRRGAASPTCRPDYIPIMCGIPDTGALPERVIEPLSVGVAGARAFRAGGIVRDAAVPAARRRPRMAARTTRFPRQVRRRGARAVADGAPARRAGVRPARAVRAARTDRRLAEQAFGLVLAFNWKGAVDRVRDHGISTARAAGARGIPAHRRTAGTGGQHARRHALGCVPIDRAAACAAGRAGRRRALFLAQPGRIWRHHGVRRQHPRRDAHVAARDLQFHAVAGRRARRLAPGACSLSRWRCSHSRAVMRSRAASSAVSGITTTGRPMLEFELDIVRGDFRLQAGAVMEARATGVCGPSGFGQEHAARRDRRLAAAASGLPAVRRRDACRHVLRAASCGRGGATLRWSSRMDSCFPTCPSRTTCCTAIAGAIAASVASSSCR